MSWQERRDRASKAKKERDEENARLRAILALDEPTTEETFGLFAPQAVRDQMAASALIKERLNIARALIYLGFKIETIEMLSPKRATLALAERIFGTPGCQAILNEINATEIAPTTDALIQRLKQTAFSDDDKVSTQAAAVLAKLMGLNKEKPVVNVDARSQNLFLVGQKGATQAALNGGAKEIATDEFLTYEPKEEGVAIFEVSEGE